MFDPRLSGSPCALSVYLLITHRYSLSVYPILVNKMAQLEVYDGKGDEDDLEE